jgi:hypothetical protein
VLVEVGLAAVAWLQVGYASYDRSVLLFMP